MKNFRLRLLVTCIGLTTGGLVLVAVARAKAVRQPTHVEEVDALRLQNKRLEIERIAAIHQAVKKERERLDETLKQAEAAFKQLDKEQQEIVALFEKKYQLDPKVDDFDAKTLEIHRRPKPTSSKPDAGTSKPDAGTTGK